MANLHSLPFEPPGLEFGAGAFESDNQRSKSGSGGGVIGSEVREIMRAIRRHRWKIAIFVAVAVLAAAVSQIVQTPQYRSTITVQVELTDEEGVNQAEAESRNAARVQNEVRIYRSSSVAARVIEDLDLLSNPTFMGDAFDPDGDYSRTDRVNAISRLTNMISVANSAQSDLLDIEVVSSDPKLASDIANQLPTAAQAMRISRRQSTRTRLLTELDMEAERLSQELAEAELALTALRGEKGMLQGAGSAEDLAQINRLAVEAASAQAASVAASERASGVGRAASMQSFGSASSPLLQQQRSRLAELEGERTRLASSFGAGHPDMVSISNEMSALQSSISAEEANVLARARADANAVAAQQRALASGEYAAAAARAARLNGAVSETTRKAFSNNANAAELAHLERNADIAREVYLSTIKRAGDVRSAIAMIGTSTSVISSAVADNEPFAPKPLRNIVGALFASVVIGILGAIAFELSDNKLRSPVQMRQLFGIPTLGMFPMIEGLKGETLDENPVIREPNSLFAEVSRGIHAMFLEMSEPKPGTSVLITSPLPGDGKSTVAISLCAAACAAGQRAIVVDFDLRRPGIMQEIQRQIGGPDLVTLLLEKPDAIPLPAPRDVNTDREVTTYRPIIISTREAVPNPSAVFLQRNVDSLLDRLRSEYDLVIINGPPALAVQDARLLARLADYTITVIRWGHTTTSQVRAMMDKMGNRIDASVFDKVDYVEHARCGYEDEVQFYMENAPYYEGSMPPRPSVLHDVKQFFRRFRKAESVA